MEEILMLYYEINNIYLELYKLELNGNIDNSIYLELVDLIKEKIDEEKELFKDLCESIDDLEYENLCNLDNETVNPFAKRIVDYMRFNNVLNMEINEYDDEEIRDKKNDVINYGKLYIVCNRNLFLIYLSFLQESIDLENCFDIKRGLLNYKYHNSFINHDVENELILNNFKIDRVNYVNLYFISRMFKLQQDIVDKIIIDCFYDTVIITIINLLLVTDMEYESNIDRKIVSINNQCMLRAVLTLFNEKDFSKIQDNVYNIINNLVDDNNKISYNIIISILNDRKKDKSRVRKLSLKPINE